MNKRLTLLLFLICSSVFVHAQNNVTVYASATDVSTWNAVPCDGTFTLWIEGTSQPYYHEYTITGPGGPYIINTIDTLVTITGLCPGSYLGNVSWNQPCYDTSLINNCGNCMPIICPTNPIPCPVDTCLNCTGGSGGNGSAGAGATVGAPPQPMSITAELVAPYLPPCYGAFAGGDTEYIVTVQGGVPPYQINTPFFSVLNASQFYASEPYVCSDGPWPGSANYNSVFGYIIVTDAVGQTATITGPSSITIPYSPPSDWGQYYCVCTASPTPIPDIDMCSGETITLSTAPLDCSLQFPEDVWWWAGGSSYGFPNVTTPLNGSITYTAPIVSTVTTFYPAVIGIEALSPSTSCSSQESFSITIHPLPIVDAGIDQTLCDGNQVTLSGAGAMSYTWNNGISDNVSFAPVLGTTTYSVVGTDGNGCQNTDQVDVTVYDLPLVDAGTDVTACDGDQITLSAITSETPTWDNSVTDGVPFLQAPGTQTYTVNITDANGCQSSDQVTVTTDALPIINAGTDQTLCEGDLATLYGSGGVSYVWDNSISDNIPFTSPIGTTTYSVLGTDANGCENTDQVDVLVNGLPTVDAGIDQTLCDGNQVTLSGAGAMSYTWNNGISDNVSFAPVLGTTTYEVIGTDVNGCQNTDQVDVTVYDLPLVDAGTDVTACDGDQITLSAITSETPTWDNSVTDGVPFLQAVGMETYTVSIIDANGCQNSDQIDVTIHPTPTINAGADQTVCDGDLTTLYGSGGVSYVWDNSISDNTPFISPIGITTYSVIGTDANGCENTDQVDVLVNGLPVVDAGIDQTICAGDFITLSGSGGMSHVWNNGITDNVPFTTFPGVGTYQVTGTDMNGCENVDQVFVTTFSLPIIDAGVDLSVCDGDSITLSGSGGTNYSWNNGVSNNTAFTPMLGTTVYELIGIDANGCTNVDSTEVLVNTLPLINAGIDQEACAGEQVILTATSGTANNFTWDNGIDNGVAFVPTLGITIFEVTGVDSNGCQNTDILDVTVYPIPNVDAGPDTLICSGDSLQLSATGDGVFEWTGGLPNNTYIYPISSQMELICSATTAFGCQNSDTMIVYLNGPINTNLILNGALITATFGFSNYEWIDCESGASLQNGPQNTFLATQDGLYKVIITDGNGCPSSSNCVTIDYLLLDESELHAINLTPNPSSGIINVSNGNQISSGIILDATGRIVSEFKGETHQLDVSNFESGYYFVRIVTVNKREITTRVVKE